MSEDPKRSASESPIDWSASPDSSFSSTPAVSLFAEPPPPEPEALDENVEVGDLPIEDLFEPKYLPVAEQHRARRLGGEARLPEKVPGRSPLAVLACLAFGGYLVWIGSLCYQDLGALHARAATVAPAMRGAIHGQHRQLTGLLVLNLVAAAPFLLGALLLLARKRAAGVFFEFLGIAATIYLLYWSVGPGRDLLRPEDMLFKLVGVALIAWVRPRVSAEGCWPA
jgi:hypothetical protein